MAGDILFNGTLRVRHAVLAVTNPATGETWTLTDVDWLTLDLANRGGGEASVTLSGALTPDGDLTLVTQEVPDGR